MRTWEVEFLHWDTDANQQFYGVTNPVVLSVENLLHVPEIDQPLGALDTRKVRDENDLLNIPGGITVDHGIFL